MEFRQIKCAPAELPLTTKRQRPRFPVVSAGISKHVAVVAVLVTFATSGATGRNIMPVAAVTHHHACKAADDCSTRNHQQYDEWQPPVGDVVGEQVERNSRAESDKDQRPSNPKKPARFRGFGVTTRFA